MRTALTTLTPVVAIAGLLAGCSAFPNRQSDADSIAAALRAVPGVTSVDPNYVNSIDRGAQFSPLVKVDRNVSAERLSDAGKSFVDRVNTVGFPEHIVGLRFDEDTDRADFLVFRFTDDSGRNKIDLSADTVAATVALWVRVMQFPGVTAIGVAQPPDNSTDPKQRSISIDVADEASGKALAARFPEVANSWRVPLVAGPR